MNREVHVRFWESAGLRCPAPLTFIKAYNSVAEARGGIGAWLGFYNDERLHQALGYQTPREIFVAGVAQKSTCGDVDNASALPTSPQAPQQQQEKDSTDSGKVIGSTIPRERLGQLITGGTLS